MIKNCLKCNKSFKTKKSHIDRGWGKFCSNSCAKIGNKINLGRKRLDMVGNTFRVGITPWNKGVPVSEITKNKISNSHKTLLSKIDKHWNMGRVVSIETRRKISEIQKGKRIGEKNPMWKKDRSTLAKKQIRNDYSYKIWRKSVWLRDKFKCKINNKDCAGRIEAHHILSWSEHPELRYEVNNGITLCHIHHPRKRSEEKRLSPYFQEIISLLNT